MPTLTSDEMRVLWRYAIDADFHALSSAASGAILPTTNKSLGSELATLPFSPSPSTPIRCFPSIDDTGAKIAIAFGSSIHIYNLNSATPSPPRILRGHVEEIAAVRFVPDSSTRLVSSSRGSILARAGHALPPGGPEILLWDTEAPPGRQAMTDSALDLASEAAVHSALGVLALRASGGSDGLGPKRAPVPGLPISTEVRYTLDPAEQAELRETIRTALRRADSTTLTLAENKLSGRLVTSFQSSIFNHAGDVLVYLPGDSPARNGDVAWDICLRDMPTPIPSTSTAAQPPRSLVLKGHRDAIMWIGFSPDDTLLASASWDKTIRVWDARTGAEKWCFRTAQQNWTGRWSPDGSQFLGTCGDGSVYLWDIQAGEEVWRYDAGEAGKGRWNRFVDCCPPCLGEGGEGGVDTSQGLIAIGSDADGRVLLLTPHRPGEGEAKAAVMERRLSTRVMETSPEIQRLASGFLGIKSVRFLLSPPGAEGSWGIKLAFSNAVEGGVEVVDLVQGKKWRIGIRTGEPDPGDEVSRYEGRGMGRREVRDEAHWVYLRRTGQVLLVDSKGVRFYDLD